MGRLHGLGSIDGTHLLESLQEGLDPCWPLPQIVTELAGEIETLEEALAAGEIPSLPGISSPAIVERRIEYLKNEIQTRDRLLSECRAQNP
jgi:hypothetical protein